jgi:hypothetical protein
MEQVISQAPERFKAISEIYEWSYGNYDAGKTPYSVFLDLIGWSHENLGHPIYSGDYNQLLGYLELDYLAKALQAVADHGLEAYEYAGLIASTESEG